MIIMDPCKMANFRNYKSATLGDFNCLNRYKHEDQMKSHQNKNIRKRFDFPYVTSNEILDSLRQLNGKRPLGPSQIPGWALRDAAPCIHIPLSFLINNAIETKKFPVFQWSQKKLKSRQFSKMLRN